ncbi:efflux transporter outer membrane subunit [Piscinibacter gummiphilus]|uniref:RND transporter n=1 Tax=Piscinibacter gummiphilus TaxID=946333 RepID=A0A1W6LG96_9BURK|nr:efflux transporter outer membrane subunit [Piscinibacter gummiphilus]ARN23243.1 RND transporter [Piscinibacter gummiphilus]ATU67944.1 RND transporter [Piscinibacter gummiphilus]GLS97233.1 outer membrane efflux protein [Piscinibacter gummiphilus]
MSTHRIAAALALLLAMAACTTGPDFTKPASPAPDDWTRWRSADESLRLPPGREELPERWWEAFGDPVLNQLQEQAVMGSPDLRTAALHFVQARVQRGAADARAWPEVGAYASVNRQRQSDFGGSTRLIDILGLPREQIVPLLVGPYNLYQAGFDLSWELDLWGRVRRSLESADADLGRQAALLDLARASLASDVARHYIDLRTTQQQIRLAREDLAALQERLELLEAKVRGGVLDHLDLERQRTDVAALKAQLPGLLAQEGASANQIALLLGTNPGALRELLAPRAEPPAPTWPDYAMGLPSEVALRRPDIRGAEAQLHRATASIGVAQADLYPSIRIGAKAGLESYVSSEFADWGSRTWMIGPSLDLPLFDRGRRKSVVQLRELDQQEAAVNYQRTVLRAWQEVDDALSGYAAARQHRQEQTRRVESAGEAFRLAQARYDGGATDFVAVLDTRRVYLQARRDLAASEGRLGLQYVGLNKALGNGPVEAR